MRAAEQGVRRMKLMKGTALVAAAILAAFAYVSFAGVRLELENSTGAEVRDIRIKHPGGVLTLPALGANATAKWLVGKIGEGAAFEVQWEGRAGKPEQTCQGVYFTGYGYETVRIRLRPEGGSELIYAERTSPSYVPPDRPCVNQRLPNRALQPTAFGGG